MLALSCGLFGIGLCGVLIRRDLVAVLASIEVMLGGALLLLVGLAGSMPGIKPQGAHGIGVIVLVIIAAEAAVGLALLVSVARSLSTTRIDDLKEVRG
jgi:NADH-quinone oxidoreductase subunit K